jgi:hypothetical protein
VVTPFAPYRETTSNDGQEGIGYSDQTIHLGTYDASLEQLEQLGARTSSSRLSADADSTYQLERRVA